MPKYIDADILKERLEDFSKWCRDGRKQGVDFVLDCPLPDIPTADVVPRSEVEGLEKENEILSKSNKTLAFSRTRIEAEIEKAKQEVAREIFEEIEKNMVTIDDIDFNRFRAIGRRTFEELKKKHIGE
jgi:hypothetical protein